MCLRIILLSLSLAWGTATSAQYVNVWAFGNNAGVDFNTNPPTAITTAISTSEGSASICDSNGRLLFYTDGTSVWDRNNQLMPNGQDLPGVGLNITASTSQGALIVPMPGSPDKYYIFSLGNLVAFLESSPHFGRLYYSIVDMQLNNGLGDIDINTKSVLLDTTLGEQVIAVSGNNCNIWLLAAARPDKFKAYNIDMNGIAPDPVVSVRVAGERLAKDYLGTLDITPDRSRLVLSKGNIVLYDFDAASGRVSNPVELAPDLLDNYYGTAFSGDNSKVYASSVNGLRQFDLASGDPATIISSGTTIAGGTATRWAMKRAPDGKIYIAGGSFLHVINKPNLPGAACELVLNGFPLLSGTKAEIGLPNYTSIVTTRKLTRSKKDTAYCITAYRLPAIDTTGINYVWDDGTTGPFRSVTSPGTYWVNYQVSSPCMFDECTDTIKFFYDTTRYIAAFTADTIVCQNNPVQFTNTSATRFKDFTWLFGDGASSDSKDPTHTYSVPGIYTASLIGTTNETCPDTAYKTIEVQPLPDVHINNDTTLCYATLLQLHSSVTPAAYHAYTYNWTPATAINDPWAPHPLLSATTDQTITLIVTTPHRCSDTAKVQITVRPQHFFNISPADTGLCTMDTIHTRTAGEAISYQWTPAIGISNSTIADPILYPSSSMTYTITGVDNYGCTDSQQVRITYHPKALLHLPDTMLIYDQQPYRMQSSGNALYHRWSPAGGLSATDIADPLVTPEVNTRYYLTAITEQGCTATDSIDILVSYDTYLDVPNAFTPGSGQNPELKLIKRGAVVLKSFDIYDRWGKQVFHTTDIDHGWDGTAGGLPQQLGVYVYKLDAITAKGQKIRKQGNITLLK